MPGSLNKDKSMALSANHVPGYINKPLPALLSEKYTCKARLYNDAVVAGLEKALYGTANKSDFIYIIWGNWYWRSNSCLSRR